MKTHYAHIEGGNESDPETHYSRTFCGLEYYESPATDNKKYVTCKNCLKTINRNNRIVRDGVASAYLRGEFFKAQINQFAFFHSNLSY